MAVSTNTEDLFMSVLSSSRKVFWAEHSHLSEPARQQLWSERLGQFMYTSTPPAGPSTNDNQDDSGSHEAFGKRSREDIPRTQPAGIPSSKRRATSSETPRLADQKTNPSTTSTPAVPQMTRRASRARPGASPIQKNVSKQSSKPRAKGSQASSASQGHQAVSSDPQLRVDDVHEYSPAEYAQRHSLDGLCDSSLVNYSVGDFTGARSDQRQRLNSSEHQVRPQASSQPTAVEMSRSTTTDSLCGGMNMIRFNSNRSTTNHLALPDTQSSPHFSQQSFDLNNDSRYSVASSSISSSHFGNMTHVGFSQSLPESGHAYLPISSSASATSLASSPSSSSPLPLTPSSVQMKHSLSSESSSSSLSSQSRAARRTQEQIAQAARPIAPKQEMKRTSQSTSAEQKMIRIASEDGKQREVAAIPKANVQRPCRPKTYCSYCNEQPDGFHGEHELRRHIERVHSVVRKVWVCVDISPDKKFLAGCKACRNGKRYGANYNAAAHLRRTHFNPCPRPRGGRGKDSSEKRGGKGGGILPSMDVLKHWMEQREEFVLDNAQAFLKDTSAVDDRQLPEPESDSSSSGDSQNNIVTPTSQMDDFFVESSTVDMYQQPMNFELDDLTLPANGGWDMNGQSMAGGYMDMDMNSMNVFGSSLYCDSSFVDNRQQSQADAELDSYVQFLS